MGGIVASRFMASLSCGNLLTGPGWTNNAPHILLSRGLWKSRNGELMRRISSLRNIRDTGTRKARERVVRGVDDLQQLFKRRMQDGSIAQCECGDPNCPTYILQGDVGTDLHHASTAILQRVRALMPNIDSRVA